MNIKRVYTKKIKGYNTFAKKDFARFVETLFKSGSISAKPLADTTDKRTLAYLYEKGKVDEKTIYEVLRKAQLS